MRLHLTGIVIASLFLACSGSYPPLETVPSVDIERYSGKWYEIARLPNRFEENCVCVAAEYLPQENGEIRVVNSCRKDSLTGREDRIEGKAFVVDGSNNAKLLVQFFWPFRGDYWILWLADDYSVALVGTPSRKYLWILARTPTISDEVYKKLLAVAVEKKFDVTTILRVPHCHQ